MHLIYANVQGEMHQTISQWCGLNFAHQSSEPRTTIVHSLHFHQPKPLEELLSLRKRHIRPHPRPQSLHNPPRDPKTNLALHPPKSKRPIIHQFQLPSLKPCPKSTPMPQCIPRNRPINLPPPLNPQPQSHQPLNNPPHAKSRQTRPSPHNSPQASSYRLTTTDGNPFHSSAPRRSTGASLSPSLVRCEGTT